MNDSYNTKDLGLAAAAREARLPMEISFINHVATFHFSDRARVQGLADDYFSNNLPVDALTFYMATKALKAMIFQERES